MPATGLILVDTNVLIYHMNGVLSVDLKTQLLQALIAGRLSISVITRIELLAWRNHTELSIGKTLKLLKLLPEFELTGPIAEDTIRIRRDFGLKLPDAVIAATARVHAQTLLTGNGADFARVQGLSLHLV